MKILIVQGLFILMALAGFSYNSYGQPPKPSNGHHQGERVPEEKIKVLKIAYLTSKLDLTTDEAQVFWPVYNAYQDAKFEVHKAQMQISKTLKVKLNELTDAELNKLMDDYISLEERESSLKIAYLQKFRKVLPIKKVAMLQKAEHDFKVEVLRELRNRGNGPGSPIPGSSN